ncbi:histidine phosphatase family protein [Oscillatoria amoena NRMC-F 0135]|nr:histidine phosphatase family protein [Oscillatoria amoena NRMC-F 0135]
MKTLYIIRHAKSSWDEPGLSDFERPLNDRGKKDAPRMGKRLNERGINPNLMLSSPAKRALSTCRRICRELHDTEERIKTEKRLYHADSGTIMDVVQNLDNRHHTVMVFGHNPGLTDFVNEIMHANLSNLPTCGVVAARFLTDSWKHVDASNCELLFVDFPKNQND